MRRRNELIHSIGHLMSILKLSLQEWLYGHCRLLHSFRSAGPKGAFGFPVVDMFRVPWTS
jgi:hypothetical protein